MTAATSASRAHPLPAGGTIPPMGLGTWMMGERADSRAAEVAALQAGLDLGLTLIDTAEMYASGAAEAVVGEAIRGRRDTVFLVSKVLPQNASRRGTIQACERSLKRLGTDFIDLYLLHWDGPHLWADTRAAFADLVRAGKIRHWGVSNFDPAQMRGVWDGPAGADCATDQVLYNLDRRGIEWDLLPEARRRAMPVMAYSPLEQARLLRHDALVRAGRELGTSAAAVALAWLLAQPGVIPIPKSSSVERVQEFRTALDLTLPGEITDRLDRAFPPPRAATPLAVL
ncbi:MAG: aldo/keto reductase [Alphaproteobacteria bacterium]|nr:MAG: aldo/keto reductase [Alphaproteobacteria bacterium]